MLGDMSEKKGFVSVDMDDPKSRQISKMNPRVNQELVFSPFPDRPPVIEKKIDGDIETEQLIYHLDGKRFVLDSNGNLRVIDGYGISAEANRREIWTLSYAIRRCTDHEIKNFARKKLSDRLKRITGW